MSRKISKKENSNIEKVIVIDGEIWNEEDALNNWNKTAPDFLKATQTFDNYLKFLYENYGIEKSKINR